MKKKWLSKNDFIKALEEKGIEFDKSQIEYIYRPWDEVERSLNNGLNTQHKLKPLPNHSPCPLCGKPSEELLWICHDIDPDTWHCVCGLLSICPNCKCQVEFINLPIFVL